MELHNFNWYQMFNNSAKKAVKNIISQSNDTAHSEPIFLKSWADLAQWADLAGGGDLISEVTKSSGC